MKRRNIVITGASRGLGRALAIAAAQAGHHLALVARGEPELREVAHRIQSAGGHAHVIVADVGQPGAAVTIAHRAAALLGEIDVLVHNASQLGPTPLREFLDTEPSAFEEVLQTNLLGPFRITKAIAGSMVLRRRGNIVLISSDAAVEAYPTWGAYGASKAALDHMGRVLAEELREHGVRVLSIDPGEMGTQMHAAAIPDADPSSLARPEAVAARILAILDPEQGPQTGARIIASQWKAVAP